jgi:hypothetical protein
MNSLDRCRQLYYLVTDGINRTRQLEPLPSRMSGRSGHVNNSPGRSDNRSLT